MFEQHKTLVQKYAHVKVPHLRKQPCLIALCAKVWGTSVFALAKGAQRGAKKKKTHRTQALCSSLASVASTETRLRVRHRQSRDAKMSEGKQGQERE